MRNFKNVKWNVMLCTVLALIEDSRATDFYIDLNLSVILDNKRFLTLFGDILLLQNKSYL